MDLHAANKALFTRWYEEVWNNGSLDVCDELIGPAFTQHGGGQHVAGGPATVAAVVRSWRQAFPDGRWGIRALLGERDLVAAHVVMEGTHTGEFQGIPPTGRKVSVYSIGVERFQDGRMAESWREIDMLGLLQQLGVIPAGAQGTVYDQTTAFHPTGPSTSSVEENKAAMIHYVEAVNAVTPGSAEGWARANQYVDKENYLWHSAAWGAQRLDHDMETYNMVKSAVPDLTFIPQEAIMVGEGDLLATPGRTLGHHTGAPLFGIPATGNSLDWFGIDISRFHDGKIVERWVCADIAGLYRQLQGQG